MNMISEQRQQQAMVTENKSTLPSGVSLKFTSFLSLVSAGDELHVLADNHSRRYLSIRNAGIGSAKVSFSENSARNSGRTILPGQVLEFQDGIVPNNDVNIWSANGTRLEIVEGVLWPGFEYR